MGCKRSRVQISSVRPIPQWKSECAFCGRWLFTLGARMCYNVRHEAKNECSPRGGGVGLVRCGVLHGGGCGQGPLRRVARYWRGAVGRGKAPRYARGREARLAQDGNRLGEGHQPRVEGRADPRMAVSRQGRLRTRDRAVRRRGALSARTGDGTGDAAFRACHRLRDGRLVRFARDGARLQDSAASRRTTTQSGSTA